MPTSIVHLKIGLIFALFLFGLLLPDIDKVFQKRFWKERCWSGFYEPVSRTTDVCHLGRTWGHSWLFWMCIMMLSFGALSHIVFDLATK